MADIYGSHFEYASKSSRDYGLIVANIDTQRILNTSGETESITIFNKNVNKKYLIDVDKSKSPISFDVEIIKEDLSPIDYSERRKIEKWLFNQNSFQKFYIDIADDTNGETYEIINWKTKKSYLNCRFINPEKIESDSGVIGYKVTLEADSDMLWQDSIIKKFELNHLNEESTSVITLEIDTDINDYTYPIVTITLGDIGGDIIISNNTDDSARLTKFVDLSPLTTVIMKGEINYVNDDYYEKFCNRNFIRLLDGVNNITLIGNIKEITFEYQNRRIF